jgi:hypothetical protein
LTWRLRIPSVALACLGGFAAAWAAAPAGVEEIKTQVVSRILVFVRWPGEETAPRHSLHLCVLGDSAFGSALQALDNQMVNDRKLLVRRSAPDQLSDCQIVYVPAADAHVLSQLRGRPVVTVGDTQGLLERGAVFNLHIDGTRVGFDVGLGAARAAAIEISAKLLRLARFVKED